MPIVNATISIQDIITREPRIFGTGYPMIVLPEIPRDNFITIKGKVIPKYDVTEYIGQRIENPTFDAIEYSLKSFMRYAENAGADLVCCKSSKGSYFIKPEGVKNCSVTSDPHTMSLDLSFDVIDQSYVRYEPFQQAIEAAKEFIKRSLLIKTGINFRQNSLSPKPSPQELKARSTLRDILSERDWRGYVTNGFIVVKGISGKSYQIFMSNYKRVRVYEKGKLLSELCIHTDTSCPPSDHVLNLKLLIELDENALWAGSNIHKPLTHLNELPSKKLENNLLTHYTLLKSQVA